MEQNLRDDSDSDLDVRNPNKLKNDVKVPSGLVHGSEVKEMLEKSRAAREAELMGDEAPDQHEGPVHRIGGRIVSREEWREQQRRVDPRYKRERQRELDREFERRQKDEWKRGLEQSSERKAKAEEAIRIASEPLGRSSVSSEYDQELRKRDRWGDPLSKSGTNRDELSGLAIEKPRSKFQAPANRFNIPPGYRWDGVVRGNDFERRWFERMNEFGNKASR
jgi:pre-mRNA-splicing factor CWC26